RGAAAIRESIQQTQDQVSLRRDRQLREVERLGGGGGEALPAHVPYGAGAEREELEDAGRGKRADDVRVVGEDRWKLIGGGEGGGGAAGAGVRAGIGEGEAAAGARANAHVVCAGDVGLGGGRGRWDGVNGIDETEATAAVGVVEFVDAIGA